MFAALHKPRAVEEPLVRFETAPGEQLQVDFVVFRRGVERLSAFVATLGYSRLSYVHFVADECGFSVRLCRPYRARTKGKVERFNRYLRNSFWVPLKAKFKAASLSVDATAANVEVSRWLRDVANARIHNDLKQRPIDRFEREHDHLQSYNGVAVDWHALATRRCHHRSSRYSTPCRSTMHWRCSHEPPTRAHCRTL